MAKVRLNMANRDWLFSLARNLEEIESVWPKASELRSVINRRLPTIVSAEVIAPISADQVPVKSDA